MEQFTVGCTVSYDNEEFYVGEVSKTGNLYLWSNRSNYNGCSGDISPKTKGYEYSYTVSQSQVKLIKSNNKNMTNLIERAKLAFKTEPAKTLIKAGFFTNEELPTKEGADIYLAYLMKNDSKFKTDILDPLVEEQKKDNE